MRRDKSDLVTVRYDNEGDMSNLLAESVLHYAVRHGVKDFFVRLFNEDEPLVLPRCLFGCHSLQKLDLQDYSWKVRVPAYLGLNALRYLTLFGFSLSQHYFDSRALSTCPNLETLILVDFDLPDVGSFHIHAPNLKRLELLSDAVDFDLEIGFKFIVSAPRLRTFHFFSYSPVVCSMDCPSLEQAIIDVHPQCNMDENLCAYSVRMLNECRNANSITISLQTLKVLSAFPALLEEHRSTFYQLQCLRLKCWRDGIDFELLHAS